MDRLIPASSLFRFAARTVGMAAVCLSVCGIVVESPSAQPAGETPKLVGAVSSVPGTGSLSDLLSGKKFSIRPGIQFLKLAFSFDPPIEAERIRLESCEGEFRDGVEFFAYPGARREYSEGGSAIARADFGSRHQAISTLAIVLRHNFDVCIKNLEFRTGADAPIKVTVSPNLAEAGEVERLKREGEYDQRRQAFLGAGLEAVIDHELIPANADEDKWNFRFRGDGTFFIFGRSDEHRENTRFSVIGEYKIREATSRRIRVVLEGIRVPSAVPWDGWLCRPPCLERSPAQSTKVSDMIEIEKVSPGGFMIRNRSRPASRSLSLSDIRARPSTP